MRGVCVCVCVFMCVYFLHCVLVACSFFFVRDQNNTFCGMMLFCTSR